MRTSLNRNYVLTLIATFTILIGCEHTEPSLQSGKVTFSFKSHGNGNTGGKQKDSTTPAFVAYTLKKTDGATTEGRIELYEFNGQFVSQALKINTGFYTLDQFLVMNNENKVIYAAPIVGSDMAALVEKPLPLPVGIASEETTAVVPEVLAVEDHSPEDFGYITFGLEIVETATFKTSVTIADNTTHDPIDYNLEIIAKDAPLGTVKWRTNLSLNETGIIELPTRYAHYTFKAVKPGYIPHVQHFVGSQLPGSGSLDFEFLPESLEDFLVREEPGIVKLYLPKDRCKLYARFDLAEGANITYTFSDRVAYIPGIGTIETRALECYPDIQSLLHCSNNVNLFDNKPYATADNFCSTLTLGEKTLDDVDIDTFTMIYYTKFGRPQQQESVFYQFWKGPNNP